ncbi:MAG TPA: hypothetical protein VM639_17155 [Dongiaceae bacterium]|nr:hypothetical protein [Dongiaceae bacterium]
MSNSLATTVYADLADIDTRDKPPVDHRAVNWFAALWQAEKIRRDACHANLLSWIIGLPGGLDPAEAAASVLAYQQGQADLSLSPSLTALLQSVARYPAQQLARMRSSRRRAVAAH